MIDQQLRHAAGEANRVAADFARTPIETTGQRLRIRRRITYSVATAATLAIVVAGVTWFAPSTTLPDPASPIDTPSVIATSPLVLQAEVPPAPDFELPPDAIEVVLEPIIEFLPSDAAEISTFIAATDEAVAIGQLDGGAHRVFLVRGTAADEVRDDGSRASCILDTGEHMGSCGTGDMGNHAPAFGVFGGSLADDGTPLTVVRGEVPSGTAAVLVSTESDQWWQTPGNGIAYLVLPTDAALQWQFLAPDGSLLGDGPDFSIIDQQALTWVNSLGLQQTDQTTWKARFERACTEGVWDWDVARDLAAEFIAEDLHRSVRSEGLGEPTVDEGANALWTMAINVCRGEFPTEAIEKGPPPSS